MADYKYITETGVIVPDFADTLQQVHDEFRAIPGWEDLDLSPETPQGALATAFALERDAYLRGNAKLANQIHPDQATGVFLDGLMGLMGGQRHEATYSILHDVEMSGKATTIIPAGSIATDGTNEWQLLGTKVIDSGGTVTGDFQCTETGPNDCAPHTLDTIAQSILGWEGVDNPYGAVLGSHREPDLHLRRRRERTLAAQGIETVEAIVSALYALPEVKSVAFWENYTNAPITKDGKTLVPHSMYLVVDGGQDDDIAYALKKVRGVGPGYNGDEVVTVVDEISGQDYTVKFDRPTPINVLVKVTVKSSSVPAQIIIPQLVVNWANGETVVDAGLMVGRDISPFEIASAINEQEPRLNILNVELSDDGGSTWDASPIEMLIFELGVITHGNILVEVV